MHTLQNIKDEYYDMLNSTDTLIEFEQYLREQYIPCYDNELNLMGYMPFCNFTFKQNVKIM